MTKFGIYVHIPFCEAKCKYCSFVSSVQNIETQKKYFDALKREINLVRCDKKVTSIFFGGGTPTSVDAKFVTEILEHIKNKFSISNDAEITIEANPNSVNEEKLLAYKKAGFNRISFGVQSFSNITLKKLGRIHNVSQVFSAIKQAKNIGFANISIDLILGANAVNKNNFTKNIERVKNLGVTHISSYILMLEQGTKLYNEVKNKQTKILSENSVVKDYYFVKNTLEKLGFNQYEISNFALKGYESRHNKNYWEVGEYLGFGISAHSYVDNERYENISVLSEYLKPNMKLNKIQINKEKISKEQRIEEYVMLSMRTRDGIDLSKLKKIGYDVLTEKKKEIEILKNEGLIKVTDNCLSLSEKGLVVSNSIILELI